ncbi:ABC transporter permease [Paenibacillus tyrfis]|uniref:ABC transporter permease n=1 Tax=Paenibacillus tyrfis TaxID=1501230 RepID=UPI00209CCD79|nr:ABC transporter permease [Paenibacillus tyrfis]MCP1312433.1 ABC transporter permease [Paenibacillus tyrfis]
MKSGKVIYTEIAGIIVAALIAIIIGFIIILIVSNEPAAAIESFLLGPLSNGFNFGTIINKAIPLIFTGLALSVVFQAKVFSMGAEGQLYIGAFVGTLVALYVPGIPPVLHIPLILLSAILAGAAFAFIPGLLKAYLNADEIVTTLMLNFVAILTTSYFVNNVFKDPGSGGFAKMLNINTELRMVRLFHSLPIHGGIVVALLAVVVIYLLIYKTGFGYELRIVGKNKDFAHYGGVSTKRVVVISVMLSGALAGLGGIIEVLGVHGTFRDNFSAGLGFDGIIIALLARNHPVGVLFASLFYAYLQVGAQTMQAGSDVPRELAIIVQVLLVILISSKSIFAWIKEYKKKGELKHAL